MTGGGPAVRRVYVDTSAYLSLLLRDKEAERVSHAITGAEVLSSVLLILETRRNLVRLARQGKLQREHYEQCLERTEEDMARFELRDLTLDLCALQVVPPVAMPRSLDLAHLRTALWFHAQSPINCFVTLDVTQAQAAKALGLPV